MTRRLRPLLLAALLAPPHALAAPGAGVAVPAMPDRYAGGAAGVVPETPWWREFGDPRLDALMSSALGENLDLLQAADRVAQAEAATLNAVAALLPTLNLDATINGQPAALRFAQFAGGAADVDGFYYFATTGFNGALDLDVTGRGTLGWQAARNEARAAGQDVAATGLTLASRVAGSWFDVALQRSRLALLDQQVQANRNILEVVEARLARGEATGVEVLQQRQQLAATQAQVPLARAAETISAQQLAVLLGRPPEATPPGLAGALPEVPPQPSTGTPDDLLRNRPDLVASELRLRSAWQRRLAAERGFLPSLRVSGNAGWSFTNNAGSEALFGRGGNQLEPVFGLFRQLDAYVRERDPTFPGFEFPTSEPEAPLGFQQWFTWSVGAALQFPLINVRNVANLRQARATERLAAHTLAGRQLTALAQVEGALAQDAEQRRRLELVRVQAFAARQAFDAAAARYAEGVGDYLTVLNTLVARQNAELLALQAHRDALAARIQLHEALGGRWTRQVQEDLR